MRITNKAAKVVIYAILIIGLIVSIFPFYWLMVTATLQSQDILRFPPVMTPGNRFFINYNSLINTVRFGRSMLNTLFVAGTVMVSVSIFSSLAGFLFAKFTFPGKKFLFAIVLMTMMIPVQLLLVPLFIIMNQLNWGSTFQALIVPNLVNAFGIFWIRQYAETAIHDDLLNAGRIDGCGTLRLFTHIGFPVLLPAVSFLALFTFMNMWNDSLWPLVVMTRSDRFTIQLAIAQLYGTFYMVDYGMVMAGTFLATLPLIIVFLLVGRQFMNNIAIGAIKG